MQIAFWLTMHGRITKVQRKVSTGVQAQYGPFKNIINLEQFCVWQTTKLLDRPNLDAITKRLT